MALAAFRPGVHTFNYTVNSVLTTVGITTSDGVRLRWRTSEAKINNTNAYGDSLIDGVYRGVNAQLLFTLKEMNPAIEAMLWPFGATSPPRLDGTLGLIGQLSSAAAKVITLVPQALSPATVTTINSGSTLTALAKLAPDNDIDMLFGPVETDIAVLLDLFVYDDSGTKRIWKWS